MTITLHRCVLCGRYGINDRGADTIGQVYVVERKIRGVKVWVCASHRDEDDDE